MRCAQRFCSARNCGNWYSVVSRAYLPQGIPGLDCVLTGMATLRVCALRGHHGPCSYCASGIWSASCFCGFYFICDSCYVPYCMPCSCCMPCPALVVYPDCPWSLNIPSRGFRALHVGRDPGRGRLWGRPVEGSWLICIAPHPAEMTATWPLSDQSTVGIGGPSP